MDSKVSNNDSGPARARVHHQKPAVPKNSTCLCFLVTIPNVLDCPTNIKSESMFDINYHIYMTITTNSQACIRSLRGRPTQLFNVSEAPAYPAVRHRVQTIQMRCKALG
jgi:hypothetical protein